MNVSGIYKIQSKVKPNRIYIGSAINIFSRWRQHLNELNRNKHHNLILQNHYNKYGRDDLQFSILLSCDKEDLLKIEQYFLDSYKTYFNICKIAGNHLGIKYSKESRERCSKSHIGKPSNRRGTKTSEETKRKQSDAKKRLYASGYVNNRKGKKL